VPTITLYREDLERLLGVPFAPEAFERQLALVKGELDDYDAGTGEVRVELNDTNRPDLWCVEGIARQVVARRDGGAPTYPFFGDGQAATRRIVVDPGLAEVRPYIGACIARGVTVDERLLTQLVQTQEKICEVFGQKRRGIALGIYAAERLAFPLKYTAVAPDEASFVPLGVDEAMTLRQITELHPKGVRYGGIVADFARWPLLLDDVGTVLSFPPVINSRDVGEVKPGDRELFLEVTGTDLRMVALVVNILAANLADRGAQIEPVETLYPEATAWGARVTLPRHLDLTLSVPLSDFTRALGMAPGAAEAARELSAYGYEATAEDGAEPAVRVRVPPYRDDVLHPVDVIEDLAIAMGYDRFEPRMPSEFTVGTLLPIERLSDRVREAMVGLGFQEVLGNVLVAREELTDDMELHGGVPVTVANPMTASYGVLRNAVLPSLLRVERESGRAFYPHALFEVGEVAVPDDDAPMGSDTRTHVAALIAHPEANFSELAARLEMLCYDLRLEQSLEPVDHATYIPGRAGRVVVGGWEVGIIGEVSPAVLAHWGITIPCAAFELNLTQVVGYLGGA
jgi:phenylalanyl-tRNA synthetase beta chain